VIAVDENDVGVVYVAEHAEAQFLMKHQAWAVALAPAGDVDLRARIDRMNDGA
jgi:hypothetical protein